MTVAENEMRAAATTPGGEHPDAPSMDGRGAAHGQIQVAEGVDHDRNEDAPDDDVNTLDDFCSELRIERSALDGWLRQLEDEIARRCGSGRLRALIGFRRRDGRETLEWRIAGEGRGHLSGSVEVDAEATPATFPAQVRDAVAAVDLVALLMMRVDALATVDGGGTSDDWPDRQPAPAGRIGGGASAAGDREQGRGRLRAFCRETGLEPDVLQAWIASQVSYVRRMGDGDQPLAVMVAMRRRDWQLLDCIFQTNDGNSFDLRCYTGERTELWSGVVELPDLGAGLRLFGMILDELGLQAGVRWPAGRPGGRACAHP